MFKVLSIYKVTKFVYLKTAEGQFLEISSILFCGTQCTGREPCRQKKFQSW